MLSAFYLLAREKLENNRHDTMKLGFWKEKPSAEERIPPEKRTGFVYYFFRKHYPSWVYTLFIILYAIAVFLFIQFRYARSL